MRDTIITLCITTRKAYDIRVDGQLRNRDIEQIRDAIDHPEAIEGIVQAIEDKDYRVRSYDPTGKTTEATTEIETYQAREAKTKPWPTRRMKEGPMAPCQNSNPWNRRSGKRAEQAERYNRKTYTRTVFRYRTDSELAERIAMHQDIGEMSMNMLITYLLCDYFKIPLPGKNFTEYDRVTLLPLAHAPPDATWRDGVLAPPEPRTATRFDMYEKD